MTDYESLSERRERAARENANDLTLSNWKHSTRRTVVRDWSEGTPVEWTWLHGGKVSSTLSPKSRPAETEQRDD